MKVTFVVAILAVLCVMTAASAAEAKKVDRYFWVYSWSVKKVDKVIVTATYKSQTQTKWFSQPAFGYYVDYKGSQAPWYWKEECKCWIKYHYTQFEFRAPSDAVFHVCVQNAKSGKQNCGNFFSSETKEGINLKIPA